MPGVDGLFGGIATDVDEERDVQRNRKPLPGVQRVAPAEAALDRRNGRP
jgi:hypothetical protein